MHEPPQITKSYIILTHGVNMAVEVPAIFLSHSGKQKAFVENLYDALQRANHTAFFDKHTLPKGSPFPPHIFQAVDGCKVGVVVLSNDFLTSKWPMLELERLVLQKRKKDTEAIVVPLFYKLHPNDLKSQEKLSKWRRVWKKKAGQHADKWERAIKALDSFNGEVFAQETSEAAYIKRVVHLICNLVPSPILYDLSHIQGHQRFAQEVASQFQEAARQCDKVCMVGLYGVGGLGKTTMCKIMCNFYNSHLYPGKSYHIEFPSDGDHKKIVQECRKALKELVNLSDEHILNKADSFDQVAQLMRDNLRRYDVFLAIDNVWESSLEAAKRILGVSFSANSKILLTSRSEEVVKDLLRGHSNTTLGPLPSPDWQEGFQIFQDTFELGDLNSLVNRNLLDRVLKRCIFSGNYHALALKALGQYVKRACVPEGLDKIEHILQGINNSAVLQNVEDLIRLNYVNLAAEKQHMFLDIVVVVMVMADIYWSNKVKVTYEKAHQWLSFLYKEYSKITISKLIYELALDGLIQLENIDDKSAEKMIRGHDLYSDLAQREAASSARFFTERSATSVEKIEWEKLERVIVREHHHSSCIIEELQQQECRKLQVLCAKHIDFRTGIHLDLMPSLCVLKLQGGTLGSIRDWSAATGLAIVHLSHLQCAPPLTPIPSIPCLEELVIQYVETVEGPPNLDGGQHLKRLVLAESSLFKEGEEVCSSYFNSLANLESLKIEHFNSRIRVFNLNALVNLQLLDIQRCKSVKRIEGLDALKDLQRLYVKQCPYLSNLDGLSGLLQLAIVEVGGCEALKRMPDLSGLTCLESLELWNNKSMEELVGDLSPALKNVKVERCEALKRMPDLSGLTRLLRLQLRGNKSMEEVGGENLSSTLDSLQIRSCMSLRRFPSLKECVHLQELEATADCLNNIGAFTENLHNLRKVWLLIRKGTSTERLLRGSFIENLQELNLGGGEWTSISGVTQLQSLTINDCDSLLKLDVGGLPSNLKYLKVVGCTELEEIGDLSALHSLETLSLHNCPSLKKLGGLCLPPHLHRLTLHHCKSLEESTIPDVSLIPKVSIEWCGKLKDFLRE